jgi:hypothetical protein
VRLLSRSLHTAQRGAALTGYALVLAAFTAVSLAAIEGLNSASTSYLNETSSDIAESRELAFYDELEEIDSGSGGDGESGDDDDGALDYELTDSGQFQSPADGLCMTLESDGKFRQRPCSGAATQQVAVYTNAETGSTQLRIGGQCIGLEDNSSASETHYELQDCDTDNLMQLFRRNETTQQWESANNRSPVMCMDVFGGGGDGQVIQQYPCHSGDNQIWPDPSPYVPPVTAPPDPTITGGGIFGGPIPDGTSFVADGAYQDDDNVFVFSESVIVVSTDLDVGGDIIPGGTTVCSYIVWYDPADPTNGADTVATIDFGAPILTGAESTTELTDTSGFEASGITYDYSRVWESEDGFNVSGSSLSIDPNAVPGNADMLRVLTDCGA